MLHFRTYAQMQMVVLRKLLPKVPRTIDAIVGVPRAGLIPAAMLSAALHKPMLTGLQTGHPQELPHAPRILIVSDVVETGYRIGELAKTFFPEPVRAAVYVHNRAVNKVDVFGETVRSPAVFEWTLFSSEFTQQALFGFDGIFCEPVQTMPDDTPEYGAAIGAATPKYHTAYAVNVCTNRLVRWRHATMRWCAAQRLQLKNLWMQPYQTAQARAEEGLKPAEFKAHIALEHNFQYVVESDREQAIRIAKITGLDVICTSSMEHFLF